MSKVLTKTTRTFILALCITLLLTNTLILAPVVVAASDTSKTETQMTTINDIPQAEDEVLTLRAIAIDEAKKEAQAAVIEQLELIALEEEAKKEAETETVVEETEADASYYDDSVESSDTSGYEDDEYGVYDTPSVQASYSSDYLMDIDNPDPNYVGYSISLSEADRDLAERMIMGEAGSCGFVGMALVAQCIRDTYVSGGYTNIYDVLSENGYYGSTSITPSSTCKEVVRYIFDQGGSAVQHRIRVFYASNYCSSPWHEAQEYVCSFEYVRFFDM